jgi:spore coat protein U-like protein
VLIKRLPWLLPPLVCAILTGATPARAQLGGLTCLSLNITVSPLSFSYLPADPAQNSTDIKVSCAFGVLVVLPNITVSLNGGNAGSFSPRQMSAGGAERLNYNIYTTAGYAAVWGDGTNGTVTQSAGGTLLGAPDYTFTAFGLVPAGQYVSATTYTDQITVQVTF